LAAVAINFAPVQNWLVQKVANNLSQRLHSTVSIKHVDFSLFNKMLIEGALVKDKNNDTLLYAGVVKVNITDWFFLKNKPVLKYISLQNAVINLHRKDSIWNYQYLVDYFSSPKKNNTPKKNTVVFDLKEIQLQNIQFNKTDKWVGQDMIVAINKLSLIANEIDIEKKLVNLNDVNLNEVVFAQNIYKGNRPPKVKQATSPSAINNNELQWNTGGWIFKVNNILLQNCGFSNNRQTDRPAYANQFDGDHFFFKNITGKINAVKFEGDTLRAEANLASKETCGFEVKKLQANVKFTPTIMAFSKLDLQTNKSKLGNYYAMKYDNFNADFSNFLHAVSLDGNFNNSEIYCDDLAFFAPTLKTWNRVFYVSGEAKGTIDNLSAKKMQIKCGNSYLDGEVTLKGLPDINTTFIDFKSNDLRTNYTELASIIPKLKTVTEPRLSALGNINYKGNFTGFINDFVAFGTINTNLGSVTGDVNMKLPKSQLPTYSGKITTNNFKLGKFVNDNNLGSLAVDGKIIGTGFTLKDVAANFDGVVHQLDYANYNYKNITVKADFKNKLFQGFLKTNDPNLSIDKLEGSINLLDKQPQFNFEAKLKYVNFKNLGLTKTDYTLAGDFDFNFKGNNIDNFLGSAKINGAKLYSNGSQLSFDSLSLQSEIIDQKKHLTLSSNEIDVNVNGNFKIAELPDAFKVFLSRYYPSYIKKPKFTVSNQDFTFLIKTKNVDQYIQLVDKKLKGFNDAVLSGSLKLATNELNVNANIPQFEYDKKVFNNVVLQSSGNLDTLVTKINAGDIVVDDSLHFPSSDIQISSNNNLSNIKLFTGASKTLNQAELNASVETLTDGVKIHFFPSSFIVNDKKWELDKDGELTIRKSFIEASEIKFLQGKQEIVIATQMDEEGFTDKTNVVANLKNVNIDDFLPLFLKKPRLQGELTGKVTLKDPFGKQIIEYDAYADNLTLDGKYVGKTFVNGDVNTTTGNVRFNGNAKEALNDFDINGSINYKDSSENSVNIEATSRHLDASILNPYLGSVFSNIEGDAISHLKIYGRKHQYITGPVNIINGSMTVKFTKCKYKFSNQTIQFNEDEINLGELELQDTLNNVAIASGKMYHNMFDAFEFDDVQLSSNKLLLLNTTKLDNAQFYGKVVGQAKMTLSGPVTEMKMKIDGEPSKIESDSSHIYLNTGTTSKDIGVIDYIDFIQFGEQMDDAGRQKSSNNFFVDMTINANPACKVDVILDETTGDVIKGEGNGKLQIGLGSKDPLSIRGKYELTKGEYKFNFQTFAKIPFTLNKGTISWNGDPLLALIDIEANYTAKKVDVKDIASISGFKQKEDIIIVSRLSGTLQKPDIEFSFNLPEKSELAKDLFAIKKLADFKNDKNEMYKQVASLLLFNSFVSSDGNFLKNNNPIALATNTIGGVISNWLTNLFNKELEKATNGILTTYFDINSTVDLQKLNNLQANVLAGFKLLLSNRLVVLIGGNLDYNNPYSNLSKNGSLTPDITVEWLLNRDGTIRLIGFRRSSSDANAGQRNRNGVKLTYRKDFDKLSDLFKPAANKKRRKQIVKK
jgi:TamB, inner membrane protein subunit of TAM complex